VAESLLINAVQAICSCREATISIWWIWGITPFSWMEATISFLMADGKLLFLWILDRAILVRKIYGTFGKFSALVSNFLVSTISYLSH
jgi:hypothetical protein